MLNAKYLIANQELASPRLQQVATITNKNLYAYLNKTVLPRAFFVNSYLVIPDGEERLKYLNRHDFRPDSLAILEDYIDENIGYPDTSSIKITNFMPEQMTIDVYTNRTALLVLSEIYYPPGWKAILDKNIELEIYKTNHLLRSVIVPGGEHTINFVFLPESFFSGVRISVASVSILYILLIVSFIHRYKLKFQEIFKFSRDAKSSNH
jgi:uncharacterized membrane protein YfhO